MKRVLVVGATSAIAQHVAQIHAQRGDRLHLVGRNPQKLADLHERLGGQSTMQVQDLTRTQEAETVVEASIGALGGLDTVLIAHGDLGDQLESERSYGEAERIFAANFLSVVALLVPIANYLEAKGAGTIGVITSVAGDRGRPRNYTYGAAKGALNIYLQGVRSRLYASAVKVTTLKLGPVDTPMTTDHPKNALFGRPEGVAKDIVAAMDRGVPEAYVPSFWAGIMPVVKNTPEPLFQRIRFLSGR